MAGNPLNFSPKTPIQSISKALHLAKPSSQAFRKLGEADSNILLQSKPSDTEELSSTGSWFRLKPWR